MYDAYVKCVDISRQNGLSGFVQGINVETEDAVVFTIYYKPSSPNDLLPVVSNFNVEPNGSVISGALTNGQRLTGYSILVTCRRIPDKDLILTLQTDRGSISSKASALDTYGSSKEMPVGTVISSFLNFEQFNVATRNNEKSPGQIWTSNKSKWSPCDGRPIPNSKLLALAAFTNAPDLRGVFLRGINAIDPYYTVNPQNSQLNPEQRSIGEFQASSIQNHNHLISGSRGLLYYTPNWLKGGDGGDFIGAIGTPGKGNRDILRTDNDGGTSETRPNNVTVYYYIKIN